MTTGVPSPEPAKASRFAGVAGCLAVLLMMIAFCMVAMAIPTIIRTRGTRYESPALWIAIAMFASAAFLYLFSLRLSRLPLRWWVVVLGAVALAGAGQVAANMLMDMFPQSRQKRTMADLRTIATAIEARATDFNAYPPTCSMEQLAKTIEPTYIKHMPREDGWGYPFRYEAVDPFGEHSRYYLGSSGRGGKWDGPNLRDRPSRATTQFDCDIVYSSGAFLQYPEGVQTQ